jgi:hypothetical protein
VAACGAPYGYTLSVWTSGALLISAHGLPNLFHALSFMVGSVAGYALVGALAFGNLGDPGDGAVGRAPALWGNVHVLSIGGAILASYSASHFLSGNLAWPATGFAATAAYLVLLAAEFSFATRSGK